MNVKIIKLLVILSIFMASSIVHAKGSNSSFIIKSGALTLSNQNQTIGGSSQGKSILNHWTNQFRA